MSNPEIICIGQAVIDCITREIEGDPFDPATTGKARAKSITLNIGGDAVNESFVLAGMGHRVGLVCCTGDDFADDRLLFSERNRSRLLQRQGSNR